MSVLVREGIFSPASRLVRVCGAERERQKKLEEEGG
jgi:hypothetical protein